MSDGRIAARDVPTFERSPESAAAPYNRIGGGGLGGKASGLIFIGESVAEQIAGDRIPGLTVHVPRLTVLTTDVFDEFMDRNDLHAIALSDEPDEAIARAFQAAPLPDAVVADLEALVEHVRTPLAVRSSSLLEDDRYEPFAGVYQTKMTPNIQPERAARLRHLQEAIKFVYASTYFRAARNYIRATHKVLGNEKMGVIIQRAFGHHHGKRFYPEASGVGRSINFYPLGSVKPEEGVVNLVLGLGKTIMDGEVGWSYSPARPLSPPPFASAHDRLEGTQVRFWAVRMGPPRVPDPISETEYLVKSDISAAEEDGSLTFIASTLDAESHRLSPGTTATGPRVIDFAPLLVLEEYPLNEAVKTVMALCEQQMDSAVEIEFAVTFPRPHELGPARLALLQCRPMVVSHEEVDITGEELMKPNLLVASNHVMGNGTIDEIRDVIYCKPQSFEARYTRVMANQLEKMNRSLLEQGRPYLLIGFGRWGSSDPWLGIPVKWGQIAGAKVIIEATLPNMIIEPSQGSHFFHNITSFLVSYFYHFHGARPRINWRWLNTQTVEAETEFIRHVRLEHPLLVKVDGRCGRGGIWYRESDVGQSTGVRA
jgi:hypothetical protein